MITERGHTLNTIYTVGYSGWTPAQLHGAVSARNAALVDIRASPTSMRPEWRQWSLRELLGTRYHYEDALGNPNYKNGGPIALEDPERALPAIAHLLQRGPVVLLCGCRDVATCHRLTAATFLSERLGAPVEHLEPPVDVPSNTMPALTLTQPYATLIAIGAKRIETRGWARPYRGPLAIHAGQGLGPVHGQRGLRLLCNSEPFRSVLHAAGIVRLSELPLGAVVATCELVDCVPTERIVQSGGVCDLPNRDGLAHNAWPLTDQERAFGDYNPKRFGWLLANVRRLPEPIKASGALGLWNWTVHT